MSEKLTDAEFEDLARKIMFEVRLDDQGRQANEELEKAECTRRLREKHDWLQFTSGLNQSGSFGT